MESNVSGRLRAMRGLWGGIMRRHLSEAATNIASPIESVDWQAQSGSAEACVAASTAHTLRRC